MRKFVVTDIPEFQSWYTARGRPPPRADCLPAHGLIEPGVAAGFLYRTDSALMLLDGFVTNPAAGSLRRGRALHAIAKGLISLARQIGCRALISWTVERGVVSMGRRNGFRKSAQMYRFLYKDMV